MLNPRFDGARSERVALWMHSLCAMANAVAAAGFFISGSTISGVISTASLVIYLMSVLIWRRIVKRRENAPSLLGAASVPAIGTDKLEPGQLTLAGRDGGLTMASERESGGLEPWEHTE